MPGWKFAEYEMRGVPLRLEIGPKDIQKDQVVLVKRENREKLFVPMDELETKVPEVLDEIQASLYNKALNLRNSRTFKATTIEEMENILDDTQGFIKAMWCGDAECEKEVKDRTAATARCIPFEQEKISDKCVCCGKEAKEIVYWGRAY
jgi:prolyl-tRNA synthetase